jgi:6-pyruvoyltetrahydropterin/6-carboxytetrahydropterin synthase
MFRLSVETSISAAHYLDGYEGPCSELHGHNWRIVAEVESDQLNKIGMVIDFEELSGLLAEVAKRYDHRTLNQVEPFDRMNPTAEHISRLIYKELQTLLPKHVRMGKIAVWETEKCLVEYYE